MHMFTSALALNSLKTRLLLQTLLTHVQGRHVLSTAGYCIYYIYTLQSIQLIQRPSHISHAEIVCRYIVAAVNLL
jgi:hypothetical protein